MPFLHIYGIIDIYYSTLQHWGVEVVMDHYDMCLFLGALVVHSMLFPPLVLPVMLVLIKSSVIDEFDLSDLALRLVMTAAIPPTSDLLIMFQKKFPGVQVERCMGSQSTSTSHSCTPPQAATRDMPRIGGQEQLTRVHPARGEVHRPQHGQSLPKNTPESSVSGASL
jgi:acyl-CoA synthetase (AMP-forming)/AMP-acid ligase II